MFSAFLNCLKIPELRQRIFYTLGMIFVARVGANIPLPGIDPGPIQAYFDEIAQSTEGSLLGLFNLFTGGALSQGAVFALGIMPYISASIIMQLMGAVVPSLARLQQEGETGRHKINQYTRYLTIAIALVQSLLLSMGLVFSPERLFQGFTVAEYGPIIAMNPNLFLITAVIFLTAGTIILMWIGEQITQQGIGNGISLLITVGILAGLPQAVSLAYRLFNAPVGAEAAMGVGQGALMIILFVTVVAGIVMVTQGTRRIPVQYAKRVVGRKVFGGQTTYLPLKVNYAGVMPVIFASAILLFPQQIFNQLYAALGYGFLQDWANVFQHGTWPFTLAYGVLIFGFAYFWVSIMFKPIQIADDLKRNGGYIPGVRPGEPTAKFLDFTMTRLTFAGATFLLIIALFPDLMYFAYGIPFPIAVFFGGTGTLIAVGVTLDTMRQVETYLLQRHYDGFLKKGRIRGRREKTRQFMDTAEMKNLSALWIPLGLLFVIGMGAWILNLIQN